MEKKSILKSGFLNVLEHGFTRVADALSTVLLLWVLPIEEFSKLALAQAWVAPLLLLFIAPETILYRDYAVWKARGLEAFSFQVKSIRLFSWMKFGAAILISFCVSSFEFQDRFYALLWAFSLALGPQLCGVEREFLRMDLKLERLNLLNAYQKLTLLLGNLWVAIAFPERLDFLAGSALFSVFSTAFLAQRLIPPLIPGIHPGFRAFTRIWLALREFSIWHHLSGVTFGCVQTLDLLILSSFVTSERTLGLYATSVKIANLFYALPFALSNFFSIWIARQTVSPRNFLKIASQLGLLIVLQSLLIIFLSPWILPLLSHGRWSGVEMDEMKFWLICMTLGATLVSFGFIFSAWLTAKASVSELFLRANLPWFLSSLCLYGISISAGPTGAALMNPVVGLLNFILLLQLYLRTRRA